MGRNFPELLSKADKENFDRYVKRVFSEDAVSVDHTGKARFSVRDARDELVTLSKRDLDAQQKEIVKDYSRWLEHEVSDKKHIVEVGFFAKKTKDRFPGSAPEEKYRGKTRAGTLTH